MGRGLANLLTPLLSRSVHALEPPAVAPLAPATAWTVVAVSEEMDTLALGGLGDARRTRGGGDHGARCIGSFPTALCCSPTPCSQTPLPPHSRTVTAQPPVGELAEGQRRALASAPSTHRCPGAREARTAGVPSGEGEKKAIWELGAPLGAVRNRHISLRSW